MRAAQAGGRLLTEQDAGQTVEVRYPPHTCAAQAGGRLLTEQDAGQTVEVRRRADHTIGTGG